MLKIFKYLNKSRPLSSRFSYNFCAGGQLTDVVNKYLITRKANENYSIYLDTDTTV